MNAPVEAGVVAADGVPRRDPSPTDCAEAGGGLGGTALAATELLRLAGAEVRRAAFVIDLPDLGGSAKLASQAVDVRTLMGFEGD